MNDEASDEIAEGTTDDDVGGEMFAGDHTRGGDGSREGVDNELRSPAGILSGDDMGEGPDIDGVFRRHRLAIRPRLGAVGPEFSRAVALHRVLTVDGIFQSGVEDVGIGHRFASEDAGFAEMLVMTVSTRRRKRFLNRRRGHRYRRNRRRGESPFPAEGWSRDRP